MEGRLARLEATDSRVACPGPGATEEVNFDVQSAGDRPELLVVGLAMSEFNRTQYADGDPGRDG